MDQIDKSNFIINPLTNRLVKIGSPTYRSLIKNAIIADEEITNKAQRKPKKRQVVVKQVENTKKAQKLKAKLPPPPSGKQYVAVDNQVVLRDKKSKSITPEKYSKLFSRASVIVNKKLSADPEFSKLLSTVNSVDELPAKHKQRIEQMLIEEVMRIPEKAKPTSNMNIIIPTPETKKKLLKVTSSKKYESESDTDAGYGSSVSLMSDDYEMKQAVKQKKKSNSNVKSNGNKSSKQKLITVISAQRSHRPTPKTMESSDESAYEITTDQYTTSAYEDDESDDGGESDDYSSEDDA